MTAKLYTLPRFKKFKKNLLTIDLIAPELCLLIKKKVKENQRGRQTHKCNSKEGLS